MGATWRGLALETDVETLRTRSDVALPFSAVYEVEGSSFLAAAGDGWWHEHWFDAPPEAEDPELKELADLSKALGCRIVLLFGSGSSEGLYVRVYDRGGCVRTLSNMNGNWFVQGTGVQTWEAAIVERGLPEDLYRPLREHFDEDSMDEFESLMERYEGELAVYDPKDRRVIEEGVLVSGAALPRASEHDLKLMGFETHVWPAGEPIRVREKRSLWSRLFGR